MSQLLLVLSDPRRRAAVASFLAAAGASVLEAEGGLHALTQVERNTPEAVLADPGLSDLGADELQDILRSEPATAEVPFFLLAAEAPAWLTGPQDVLLDPGLTSRALAQAVLDGARHAWLDDGQSVTRHGTQGTVHMSGTLEMLSLLDLLVSFNTMHKTGCLTVQTGDQEALLLLRAGDITHAEYLESWGEVALQRAFVETQSQPSSFRFEALTPEVAEHLPRSVSVPTSRLLLELAVNLDHLQASRTTLF